MTVATLSEVLSKAKENHYAVAGLVVLGWEDARCYAETAEELGLPIILQAGPGCRANTPLPILGKMFRHLAEQSSQPIVCHLDHGYSKEECIEGMENGFTSVMFDGSKLSLNENIEKTHEIAELAHKNNISVEGEIGFVGYSEGAASQSTDPLEAKEFADKSHCDAMAISAGNVHLQTNTSSSIDTDVIEKIQSLTSIPLVLHGSSGIDHTLRRKLATSTNVCKFNIGTELRKTFGDNLRKKMNQNPNVYDRIQLINLPLQELKSVTKTVIENITKQ
ncbi:Fructose-bisphosphate aldolase class-II [alpha proteobacterium HIMB59]|nr:Fructose-bisphosphate aldolase class-II [alpha proteobacterium HIMB59]